jgi:hypothetical protein
MVRLDHLQRQPFPESLSPAASCVWLRDCPNGGPQTIPRDGVFYAECPATFRPIEQRAIGPRGI